MGSGFWILYAYCDDHHFGDHCDYQYCYCCLRFGSCDWKSEGCGWREGKECESHTVKEESVQEGEYEEGCEGLIIVCKKRNDFNN